jgi:hypothetical protein
MHKKEHVENIWRCKGAQCHRQGRFSIKNVFQDMNFCDAYHVQGWDGLQAHDGGLFFNHIFSDFKCILGILILEKAAAKRIDIQ